MSEDEKLCFLCMRSHRGALARLRSTQPNTKKKEKEKEKKNGIPPRASYRKYGKPRVSSTQRSVRLVTRKQGEIPAFVEPNRIAIVLVLPGGHARASSQPASISSSSSSSSAFETKRNKKIKNEKTQYSAQRRNKERAELWFSEIKYGVCSAFIWELDRMAIVLRDTSPSERHFSASQYLLASLVRNLIKERTTRERERERAAPRVSQISYNNYKYTH